MTADARPEPPNAYPDVRMRPRAALIFVTVLAVAYAIVFVLWAVPSKATGLTLYASLGLSTALLLLSYIDMRTGLLLDVITLPLIAAGIGFTLLSGAVWQLSIAGVVLGYGLVAGIGYVWRNLRGYEGIGLGDAKLLAAGGAWVGAGLLPVILLIASGLGIISAVTMSQSAKKTSTRSAFPFGPHLSFGIWTAWCAGDLLFR